ncbi:MAG: lysophospholipid acyltransferase family protein, partial [Pseudomonadota bacterium]
MVWIRSVIFLLFMLLITPVLALIFSPALLMGERAAYFIIRSWANFMLSVLRILCGVRHEIIGRENIPSGASIVASNHHSMWETIALMAFLPRPVMAFKREFRMNPVYRFWGYVAGIPVDRKATVSAIKSLVGEAKRFLALGRQIILFPEGTRVPLGETRPLQPGIAAVYQACKTSVVPVVHNSSMHWRHPGPMKLPGTIRIEFLPPIEPGMDRRAFLRSLEERFLSARTDLPNPETKTAA